MRFTTNYINRARWQTWKRLEDPVFHFQTLQRDEDYLFWLDKRDPSNLFFDNGIHANDIEEILPDTLRVGLDDQEVQLTNDPMLFLPYVSTTFLYFYAVDIRCMDIECLSATNIASLFLPSSVGSHIYRVQQQHIPNSHVVSGYLCRTFSGLEWRLESGGTNPSFVHPRNRLPQGVRYGLQ